MILKQHLSKFASLVAISTMFAAFSCQEEEERLTIQDSADITEEAITDSYFQELDDMAGVAIESPSDTEYSSGRKSTTITIEDHRFECNGIVVTLDSDATSTAQAPKGVITIDFGTSGCADLKGNIRKGKLILTYNGRRFMPGSTVILTTDNYSVNGVKLEGVRTLTNMQNSTSDAPRFNAVLENGKATFSNGDFATRESDITWQWNRASNPNDDYLQIESTSSANGVSRTGRTYEVSLLEPLVYKRHCGVAVSGIKRYIINGTKTVTIEYGEGECDRAFSITVNGTRRDINF